MEIHYSSLYTYYNDYHFTILASGKLGSVCITCYDISGPFELYNTLNRHSDQAKLSEETSGGSRREFAVCDWMK